MTLGGVDGRNVWSTRVPVGKSLQRDVIGVVGAVGEARIVRVELGELGMDQTRMIGNAGGIRVLHGEGNGRQDRLSLKEAQEVAVLRREWSISRDKGGWGWEKGSDVTVRSEDHPKRQRGVRIEKSEIKDPKAGI